MRKQDIENLRIKFMSGEQLQASEILDLLTYAEESMSWRTKAEEAIEDLKRII